MLPFARICLFTEQGVYNYRLSRSRRVVENVFAILTHRWCVLISPINQQPDVENMVLAGFAMHNFLREECSTVYDEPETNIPNNWNQHTSLRQAILHGSTNPTQQAKMTREVLAEYFNSENGTVAWQLDST